MKIGIIGAGAIGTLFGYKLAAGNDVTMLEVRRDIVATIKREGLRLGSGEARRVGATSESRDLFGVAVLFIFVRATDTLRALRPFVGELNPSTAIVSLQNGIGNEEAIKAALGGHIALVLGATTESSLTLAAGAALPVGEGKTVLGSGGASPEICNRIARLLDDCRYHGVDRLRYPSPPVGQAHRERRDQSGGRSARPAQRRRARRSQCR